MFHRKRHRRAELNLTGTPRQEAARRTARHPAAGQPIVEDFLPPELRVPSVDQVGGVVMPWPWPLVCGEEIVTCHRCGTYRDWLVIATRGRIWLRCRAGHQQPEPRLDTEWFNRHAGPADATHATFEDCLRYLGH